MEPVRRVNGWPQYEVNGWTVFWGGLRNGWSVKKTGRLFAGFRNAGAARHWAEKNK